MLLVKRFKLDRNGDVMSLAGKHILSVDQFERADLERILLWQTPWLPLHCAKSNSSIRGAILGNMFLNRVLAHE